MRSRCNNKNTPQYEWYGARGISICNDWSNSFETFYNWSIENGYDDALTIDRIDNNGNYEPRNCKWDTVKQQSLNRRTNHIVTLFEESKPISVFCDQYKISYRTVMSRLNRGWSYEKSLTTPVNPIYRGGSK